MPFIVRWFMDGRPIDSESASPGGLTLAHFGYDPFVGAIAHPRPKAGGHTPPGAWSTAPAEIEPKPGSDPGMITNPGKRSGGRGMPDQYSPEERSDIPEDHREAPYSRRGSVTGKASTYNPFKPGYKSGGPLTSSGERYDPNKPTAAIRTDLRDKFGGARPGHVKDAIVEYEGKKLRVRINDVGPLAPGRVIDLNEAAMKYFDPSMKKGVLHGVTVTPVGAEGRQGLGERLHHKPGNKAGGISVLPSGAHPEATGLPHAPGVSMRLSPTLSGRLQSAYRAMPADVRPSFNVISGYRPATRAQARAEGMSERSSQEDIWERHVRGEQRGPAARPGHSRHQHGEAADIGSGRALDWLHRHGHEHGLHFPVANDYPHIQAMPGWQGDSQ